MRRWKWFQWLRSKTWGRVTARIWPLIWITTTVWTTPWGTVLFGIPYQSIAPFLGAGIGCCAISIAIQQGYAFSIHSFTGSTQPQHRGVARSLYFWSSCTLVSFGAGSILGCLPNFSNIPLNPSQKIYMSYFSLVLLAIGSTSLLRFVAVYLYRYKPDLLHADSIYFVFNEKKSAWYLCGMEFGHFFLTGVYVAYVTNALYEMVTEGTGAGIYFQPIEASAYGYFWLKDTTRVWISVLGILTAICVSVFVLHKLRRVKTENEHPDGVEFALLMLVLFAAPSFVQMTLAFTSQFFSNPYAKTTLSILFIATCLCAALQHRFYPKNKSQDMFKGAPRDIWVARSMYFSMVICWPIFILFWYEPRLTNTITWLFVCLAFLTLVCARIPIFDWEKLHLGNNTGNGKNHTVH